MIKLGRLYLKNFKSFSEPILFDFNNKDLILFDGPNGFGKTTIFDAIELCFRSNINRLIPTDDKVKETHVLKSDKDKDTIICLELLSNKTDLCSIHINIPVSSKRSQNKIKVLKSNSTLLSKFPKEYAHPFEITKLTEARLSELKSKEQDLEKIISKNPNKKFKLYDSFNVFHYIQQEETAHFLKQEETERHEVVSYLFGVSEIKKKENRLSHFQGVLKKKIQAKNNKISELDVEIKKYQALETAEIKEVKSSGKIEKIERLKDPENVTEALIKNYLLSLEKTKSFIENINDYRPYLFNREIDQLISNNKQSLTKLLYVGHFNDYAEIEDIQEQYSALNKEMTKISHFRNIVKNHNELINLDNDVLQKYLRYFPHKKEEFQADISVFNSLKKANLSHSKTIQTLLSAQSNLKSTYNLCLEEEHISKENPPCPFCGESKESLQILYQEYEEQRNKFQSLLDDSSKQLSELIQKIKDELLTPIKQEMQKTIEIFDQKPPIKLVLEKRNINKEHWGAIKKLKEELQKCKVDYKQFLFDQNINDKQIGNEEEKLKQLISAIEFQKLPRETDIKFQDLIIGLNDFKIEYREIDNIPALYIKDKNIELKDLENDLNFLKFLNLKRQNDLLDRNMKKTQILNNSLNLLTSLNENLIDIIKTYKDKREDYEKEIASQLAIPFYIYSAKTLQTRLEGSGIFLNTAIEESRSDANNFIRFTSSANDDQDAWNTMSSGQISGLIISFMLAMNKVFEPTKLKTLLIDDPVQTMDEINMVSLIQLLRYEFPDYQLIMSTHESNVSDYFEYKYHTFGRRTKAINLKKRRFN